LLSDFQIQIATTVSGAAEADGFVLAGGAALIVLGVVERSTRDLDYFTTTAEAVNRAAPTIEAALKQSGFTVERIADAVGFIRLMVGRGDSRCEIDLAHDFREWPKQSTSIGKVLSLDELAADKTLALFGRAAPRDYIDVQALARIFGIERLCELAAQKDHGFDRNVFAQALNAIDRLSPERFELAQEGLAELKEWAKDAAGFLHHHDHNLGANHERAPNHGRDIDPDLGLGL
jgi:hypothetical protein